MIMSTVIVPRVFSAENFDDPLYMQNAEMLLRGIDSNGVILIDAEQRLYHALCDKVEELALVAKGRDTCIRFEEILKKKRQNIGPFVTTQCLVNPSLAQNALLHVARRCEANSLIVDSDAASQDSGSPIPVIPIREYMSSDFEKSRHYAMNEVPPVDMMEPGEFDLQVARCTRFSRVLRFYDKQIGHASNLRGFQRGIERIVRVWRAHAHFTKSSLSVELFTCVQRTHASTDVIHARILSSLVRPLAKGQQVRVTLYFKEDSTSITHDRYLQTESHSLSFSKGFDFVNEDQSLHRCVMKVDYGAQLHLQQYRSLKDAKPPTE